LKKPIFAFGLIIISIGIIIIPNYNTRRTKIGSENVAHTTDSWSIPVQLEKDDNIVVQITPPMDWAAEDAPFDPQGELQIPTLNALVTIRPQQRNATYFLLYYRPVEWRGAYILTLYNITLIQEYGQYNYTEASVPDVENDALNTASLYDETGHGFLEVGGTVEHGGAYSISIGKLNPPRKTPPSSLDILKGTLTSFYPYTFLLPAGVAIVGVGAIVSYFGLRRRSKVPVKKRVPNTSGKKGVDAQASGKA